LEVQLEPQVGSEEEERIKEIYKELGLQDRMAGRAFQFSVLSSKSQSSLFLDPSGTYV